MVQEAVGRMRKKLIKTPKEKWFKGFYEQLSGKTVPKKQFPTAVLHKVDLPNIPPFKGILTTLTGPAIINKKSIELKE